MSDDDFNFENEKITQTKWTKVQYAAVETEMKMRNERKKEKNELNMQYFYMQNE